MTLVATVPTAARCVRTLAGIGRLLAHEFAPGGEEEAAQIELAVGEAVGNVLEHAHRFDASLPVRVEFRCDDGALQVDVFDHGPGFDMTAVPALDPESLSSDGRGIYIMHALMDEVSYELGASGNRLRMVKRFVRQ